LEIVSEIIRKSLIELIAEQSQERPVHHEEKKAFMIVLSMLDQVNTLDQSVINRKLVKKITKFYTRKLLTEQQSDLARIELYQSTTFNIKFFLDRCCGNLKKDLEKAAAP